MKQFQGKTLYFEDQGHSDIFASLPERQDVLRHYNPAYDHTKIGIQLEDRRPILFMANTVTSYFSGSSHAVLLYGHFIDGTRGSLLLTDIDVYIDIFPRAFTDTGKDYGVDISKFETTKRLYVADVRKIKQSDLVTISDPDFADFVSEVANFLRLSVRYSSYAYFRSKIANLGAEQKPHIGCRIYLTDKRKYDLNNVLKSANMNPKFFTTSYNSGDLTNVLCSRYEISIGKFMVVDNYTYVTNPRPYNSGSDRYIMRTKARYNLTCKITDFTAIGSRHALADLGYNMLMISKVKSVHLHFDIETASLAVQEKMAAKANNNIVRDSNDIFNFVVNISQEDDKVGVALSIRVVNMGNGVFHDFGRKDSLTIVTKSPKLNLYALMFIIERLQPDFIIGFNSLNFDIPQVMLSLRIQGLFDEFHSRVSLSLLDDLLGYPNYSKIGSNYYRHNKSGYTYWSHTYTTPQISGLADHGSLKGNKPEQRYKIKDGQTVNYTYWDIPGIILLDTYIILWKMHSAENVDSSKTGGSLNHYLQKYYIKEKEDVPYWMIWLIYKQSTLTAEHAPQSGHKLIQPAGQSAEHAPQSENELAVAKALEGKSVAEWVMDIVNYCEYDALACKLLFDKTGFMEEKRSYTSMVYLPLLIIIYRADTSKVESALFHGMYVDEFCVIETKIKESNSGNAHSMQYQALINANPALKRCHVNYESSRNSGGHVEIHKTGKIMTEYKGQLFKVPIESFDFASLYPSVIMAYNLCITTKLAEVTTSAGDLPANCQRVSDCELTIGRRIVPQSKFLIDTKGDFYGQSHYFTRHQGRRENFGVIPKVLIKLKEIRGEIKVNMNQAEKTFKQISGEYQTKYTLQDYKREFADQVAGVDNKTVSRHYLDYIHDCLVRNNQQYADAHITYSTENGRQLAVKVVMNATYGYLDYAMMNLYLPVVAVIITMMARYYLSQGNKFAIENGKVLVYNDTDSIYFHESAEKFADIFDDYIAGKLTNEQFEERILWRSNDINLPCEMRLKYYKERFPDSGTESETDLVPESKSESELDCQLRQLPAEGFLDTINRMYVELSGDKFISQAWEESLYPGVFCGLKKYFGKKHMQKYVGDWNYSDLHIRGLKIRTGNCTEFERAFTKNMMFDIINSNDSVSDIVYRELDKLFESGRVFASESNDEVNRFRMVNRYKSNAKNIAMSIINKSQQIRQHLEPGTRLYQLHAKPFELESVFYVYVILKRTFDIMGRKVDVRCETSCERIDVARYLGSEIDIYKYITIVLATCAQLLSHRKDFGWEDGMLHKDYTKKIRDSLLKYCAAKQHLVYPEVLNEKSRKTGYTKWFRRNLPAINSYCDRLYGEIGWLMRHMINVDKKIKFSGKMRNLVRWMNIDAIRSQVDLQAYRPRFIVGFSKLLEEVEEQADLVRNRFELALYDICVSSYEAGFDFDCNTLLLSESELVAVCLYCRRLRLYAAVLFIHRVYIDAESKKALVISAL